MAKRDFYEVLGVQDNATPDEIKRAFRRLAKRYHPDANRNDPSAEGRFKEANEAYEVLSDPKKRAQYDQMKKYGAFGGYPGGGGYGGPYPGGYPGGPFPGGPGGGYPGGFPGGGFPGGPGGAEDLFGGGGFSFGGSLADIFEQLFGGMGGRARGGPAGGGDIEVALNVPLETARRGGYATFTVSRHGACPDCHGSGAAAGTSPVPCPVCKGRGRVAQDRGGFSVSRTCPRCFGRGRIVEKPCPACGGQGDRAVPQKLRVRIPKDSRDGQLLRLKGQGEPGEDGHPPGDLIVELRVSGEEPFLRREGLDVVCTVQLSAAQATRGVKVKVKTREGKKAVVTVPAGAQDGQRLRLPGLGYAVGGKRGDQIVELRVAEETAGGKPGTEAPTA